MLKKISMNCMFEQYSCYKITIQKCLQKYYLKNYHNKWCIEKNCNDFDLLFIEKLMSHI